jgi:hypothetical protein
VEAWLGYEAHFRAGQLVSGRHIIEILANHCSNMASDPCLQRDPAARDKLRASLAPRTSQLWSDVETAMASSEAAFVGNMDALADHLENACPA